MTSFFLIRHGNTNAGNVLIGRSPGFSLSDNGKEQIEAMAKQYLLNIKFDKFLCSPMQRTKESAGIICKHIKLDPEISEDLNEIDFGNWTGKSFDELEKEHEWKLFHSFRSGSKIPGGESIAEIQKRIIDLIVNLYKSFPQGNVLLVTHAEIIKILFSHFSGIHLDNSYKIQIDTGSLSIIKIDSGGASISGINLPGRVI